MMGARIPAWMHRRLEDSGGDRSRDLAVAVFHAARRHRTSGHAAEMAFFAVLTLVPSTVAVGSVLGFSERLVGPVAVAEAETAAIRAIRALMGPS